FRNNESPSCGPGNVSYDIPIVVQAGGAPSPPFAIQSNTNICSGANTLSALGPNLVAHYPFDGNMNDVSGNGLNLSTIAGAASYSENGLVLNTGDRFQSPANSYLSGVLNYTIEFDMKVTN